MQLRSRRGIVPLAWDEFSRREIRGGLDLLDLLGMPHAVQAEDKQPLVAIEFTKNRVRMKVTPQIALGGNGKFGGALVSLPEFGEQLA